VLVRFQFQQPPGKKSGTMLKLVIEISLARYWFCRCLRSPPRAAGRRGQAAEREENRCGLARAGSPVPLGVEFAEEFSLFDYSLYGALPDKSSNRESILQLKRRNPLTNPGWAALHKMDWWSTDRWGVLSATGNHEQEWPRKSGSSRMSWPDEMKTTGNKKIDI